MATKITDQNATPYSTLSSGMRTKIFSSLGKAKDSLVADHPAHAHINACVKMLGGSVVDRTEDQGGGPGNLTSPGVIENLPSRIGSDTSIAGGSDISGKATQNRIVKALGGTHEPASSYQDKASERRDFIVSDLYKRAAASTDRVEKTRLERLAQRIDAAELSELTAISLLGGHSLETTRKSLNRGFWDRHKQPF